MKRGVKLAYNDDIFPDTRSVVPVRAPVEWISVEKLRIAERVTLLISTKCNFKKFVIGRRAGQDNLFEMLKNGRRIKQERIEALASIFGLTLDLFLELNEDNFEEYKAGIVATFSTDNPYI